MYTVFKATVLPVGTLLCLEALSGLALHRLQWPFLVRSGVAALLAVAVWGAGMYLVLYKDADPSEMGGPPLLGPVITILLTALAPAVMVSWLMHARARNRVASKPAEANQ